MRGGPSALSAYALFRLRDPARGADTVKLLEGAAKEPWVILLSLQSTKERVRPQIFPGPDVAFRRKRAARSDERRACRPTTRESLFDRFLLRYELSYLLRPSNLRA